MDDPLSSWNVLQDLLMAKWPMQLQQNEQTCVRFMSNGSPTALPTRQDFPMDVQQDMSRLASSASVALQSPGNFFRGPSPKALFQHDSYMH